MHLAATHAAAKRVGAPEAEWAGQSGARASAYTAARTRLPGGPSRLTIAYLPFPRAYPTNISLGIFPLNDSYALPKMGLLPTSPSM